MIYLAVGVLWILAGIAGVVLALWSGKKIIGSPCPDKLRTLFVGLGVCGPFMLAAVIVVMPILAVSLPSKGKRNEDACVASEGQGK